MKIKTAEKFKDVRFVIATRESGTEYYVWFLKEWEGFEDADVDTGNQLSEKLTMDKAILVLAAPTALKAIFERFGATTESYFYSPFCVLKVNWPRSFH